MGLARTLMRTIVWLHGDSLSPADPALVANPGAPAIFVFDEGFLARVGLSFKRLFFLYECALEAIEGRDGEIHRGDVVAEVWAFAVARGATAVHVTASVAPGFRSRLDALRARMPVVVHEPQPLVAWRGAAPRRFSAFWRTAEPEALRPTGAGPAELRDEGGDG
ncbi:MAG: hypothetical protein OHK0015_06420 [Chloroflexi bacterium OHK40]